MATKPLTNEAIALTEKKVDMALDEIVKMSKTNTDKGKKQWRTSNKSQKLSSPAKDNTLKARRYMDSRSSVRQGAYAAKRRSNFQGIQFPVTNNVAHRAASAAAATRPFVRTLNAGKMFSMNISRFVDLPASTGASKGGFPAKAAQQREHADQKQVGNGWPRHRPQTLDSLFANMKAERKKRFLQQNDSYSRTNDMRGRPIVPWARGRYFN